VLGELGHWGQESTVNRSTGPTEVGVRATLPMWAVDPTVQSALWNVHGLAHKVDFEIEASPPTPITADQPSLYDPLDDWSIEAFRRRFITEPTAFPVPRRAPPPCRRKSIERYYACAPAWRLGHGAEHGDRRRMEEIRFGVHQRWQTKRGPEDDFHIIDWITFDTDVTFYPIPTETISASR